MDHDVTGWVLQARAVIWLGRPQEDACALEAAARTHSLWKLSPGTSAAALWWASQVLQQAAVCQLRRLPPCSKQRSACLQYSNVLVTWRD